MEKGERLFCLDILRGLDMLYLACISGILSAVFHTWPEFYKTFPHIGSQPFAMFLTGHPWFGFTLYDLIMPLFIFMSGAAVPFALGRRLSPEGRPTKAFYTHIVWRVVMLWTLGMLAQGSLNSWDIKQIWPYSNTLQAIAVGYVVTAFVMLIPKLWARILIPVGLLVAYGFIIHLGGDYDKAGNAAQLLELKVFAAMWPNGHPAIDYAIKYGYVWILPSMMFPVLALGGCFATQILRNRAWSEWRRAAYLAIYGVGALLTGLILEGCGIKCVKHFFSVSFTLQAIGWSVLALDALFVITDIGKHRRGTWLVLLFGQFALTAYLCECAFRGVCLNMWQRLFSGLYGYANEFAWWCGCSPAVKLTAVMDAIGLSIVIVAVLCIRRRLVVGRW